MAYYSSDCNRYDLVGYENSTAYASDYYYDYAPIQSIVPYSSYEIQEPTRSEIGYSVSSSVGQPELVQCDLSDPYGDDGYNLYKTHFTISYDVTDFNEAVDEDYDPTPYEGGYDIALTYGKPLQSSEEICYPKSNSDIPIAPAPAPTPAPKSNSDIPIAPAPVGSLPLAHVKEDEFEKGQDGIEPKEAKEEPHDIDMVEDGASETEEEEQPIALPQGQAEEGIFVDDQHSWTGYGTNGFDSGRSEDYGYEVCQTPIEYAPSSDCMGFVESLFGHWPWLSRKEYRSYNHGQAEEDGERNYSHWNGTADYFFGRSNCSYRDGRDEGVGYVRTIYGYERHGQQELEHRQIQYNESSSWLQEFNTS